MKINNNFHACLFFVAASMFLMTVAGNVSAQLTVTPTTWNVIGLDSSQVTNGPDKFPVGVRVCNTTGAAINNVTGTYNWTSANTYLNLEAGNSVNVGTLGAGFCTDIYFIVVVTRNSSAYNTTRGYRLDVTGDGLGTFSSPTPRELFVERMAPQAINNILSLSGGATVYVGGVYAYTLNASTATNGYEQLEAFLPFPSNVFQVLSIATVYSAPAIATINTKFYADACGWDNAPASATYRSCVGPEQFTGGKAGGIISTTYLVKVIGTGSSTVTPVVYDFSDGTYHYNSDCGNLSLNIAALPAYSIGNRVWLDNGAGGGVSNNGTQDGSEAGVSGVSVSLFTDADGNGVPDLPLLPFATVTTDSNGYYRFDQVLSGRYVVRVNASNFATGQPLANRVSSAGTTVNSGSNSTDRRDNGVDNLFPAINGILSGSFNLATKTIPTGETDNQTVGIYGSGASTGGEQVNNRTDLTIDFGFRPSAPSAVTLKSATAETDGARTVLRWQTGMEVSNLGFRVYRQEGQARHEITPALIAGSGFLAGVDFVHEDGFSYAWTDNQPPPDAAYYLEDLDFKGHTTLHGPFYPVAAKKSLAGATQARLLPELNTAHAARSTQTDFPKPAPALRPHANSAKVTAPANDAETDGFGGRMAFHPARGPALKIAVNRDGWQRLSRAALETAGLPADSDANSFQLWREGQTLPLLINNQGGVDFYGSPLDTDETDQAIYWLTWGGAPGPRVAQAQADARDTQPDAWYWHTAERRDRTLYAPSIRNGAASNFFGAIVSPGGPTLQTLTADAVAPNATGAELEVALHGGNVNAHSVQVELNGVALGTVDFNGQIFQRRRFSLTPGQARNGVNEIRLTPLAGASDVSVVSYIRLTYGRSYQAANNTLTATQAAGVPVTLTGFTNDKVRVWDITEARAVKELIVTPEAVAGGQFALRLAGGATERRLFVSAREPETPARVWANSPSALQTRQKGAEAVIVTPAAFRPAAEQWANLRRNSGLRSVRVVDVEDIYDEFNNGVPSQAAINDFVAYTRRAWATAPRYLLLLGSGNYDPRDFRGLHQTSWLPVPLVDTAYLETASDDWYGDSDNDGLAEIAIGRLPARTLAEANAMIAKIAAYETQAPAAQRGAALISDNGFAGANTQFQTQLAGRMPVASVTREGQSDAQARSEILTRLNAGPSLVQYTGHGSVQGWTSASLLQSADAPQLGNANGLSVYVLLTCLNGYYHDLTNDALGAALVRAPGGAVATWSSSGLTLEAPQSQMAQGFYQAWLDNGARLGDAVRQAKAATTDLDVRRTWILLGDPTLIMR